MGTAKVAVSSLLSAVLFLAVFGAFGLLPNKAFSDFGLLTIFIYMLTNVLVIRN